MSTDLVPPQGDDEQQDPPQGETQTPPQGDADAKLAKAVAESRKWEQRAKADAKALQDLKASMKGLVSPDEVADKEKALADALALANANAMTATKYRVALAEGLPQDLAERLVGTTEDELREDATRLKALLKPTAPARDAKGGQGHQTPPAKPNPNDLLRLIAKG